jgi:hypothetical protein
MKDLLQRLLGVPGADMTGAESWSVRLVGMPSDVAAVLALLVLFGLFCWFTVRCYRREGNAPRRVKALLAALRIALIGLVFLAILQPTVVIRFTRAQAGVVAVLVDDTLSMRWRDRYPDDGVKAALAKLLSVPAARMDAEDRFTRTEAIRTALLRPGGVLERLAGTHTLALFKFGGAGRDSAFYLETLGESGPTRGAGGDAETEALRVARSGLGGLVGDGTYTDLAKAVREALNALDGRHVSAVVVVSDGRNAGTEDSRARLAGAIQIAQQRGIPIYSVAVGNPEPPRNVAVMQLQCPAEVRAKSTLSLTAFITHRALAGTPVAVRLLRSPAGTNRWEDTGVSAQVTLADEPADAGGKGQSDVLQEVGLSVEAPDVGLYTFKARIEPVPDEMMVNDNEAAADVRVTDQKLSVLLVGGSPSREFQYLRNFLLKNSDHFAASMWQQNADERFNQDASTGMKRSALPVSLQELIVYDVVVLCDPRQMPGSFDERFLGLLDGFVGKHHGGVCYVAGHKFTSDTLTIPGSFDALAALLPVVLAPASRATARMDDWREPHPLELAPEGRIHAVTRLATESGRNEDLWRNLPGVHRCQKVARLKTLATALAVNGNPTRTTANGEREPAIAVQHYGRGRVLFLGSEESWRWRSLGGAAHYERFWANTLDFLGAGRLDKKRILITTAGDVFDAGSDIDVRIEAYNRDFTAMDVKSLTVEMRAADGAKAASRAIPKEKPGFFRGTLPADREGTFHLYVKSDDTGLSDWTAEDVSARRLQVRLPQAEFLKPEADYQSLRDAAVKGDRFLLLHEVDKLAERVPTGTIATTTSVPVPLWSTPAMLAVLGILILTEWVLRKVFHMT